MMGGAIINGGRSSRYGNNMDGQFDQSNEEDNWDES
jgi:hypothetical protein|tara:strand:+ start:525 stop:632 length:108 start_codon:yes stop_codon:yes gene_type:complete